MRHRQHLAIVAGRDAEPVLPVIARNRAVVHPALRKCRLARIQEAQGALPTARALHAEIKPLQDIRMRIAAEAQLDCIGIFRADDFNCTRVELMADLDWHGLKILFRW